MALQVELSHQKQYRIIPSTFPPINFFEDLVDPDEMDVLYEIESLTNERLRQEVGDIFLVPVEDRVSGVGASIIMAAFTHIYKPSRFTDGSYGVYYAGLTLETAIKETVFHRENFLRATRENACNLTMRVYEGTINKALHDIRGPEYASLHHQDDYKESQIFGKNLKKLHEWGLIYNSVRHIGGHCIAIFRPPAVSIPRQKALLSYHWNGHQIVTVFDTKVIMTFEQSQSTSEIIK